jgi:hypothetical protein
MDNILAYRSDTGCTGLDFAEHRGNMLLDHPRLSNRVVGGMVTLGGVFGQFGFRPYA